MAHTPRALRERRTLLAAAAYDDEQTALADLEELGRAFRDERVRPARAVVATTGARGPRLVRRVTGPRNLVLGALVLTFWLWEPIWLWIALASVAGAVGRHRRHRLRPELQELLDFSRRAPATVVAAVASRDAAVLEGRLERSTARRDLDVGLDWGDVVHELRLGWIAQRRFARAERRAAA